ncbi:membrane protein DedA, SNARE-associated domain [Halogranum amylolyticum]|uniref:Membrane protein DedA, SNARE-associated domain n=1 Tax=Halogranum amylolyticum TaxID=660520 RepID=A0A1H8QWU7_9EURY|nr:VTT domain-containing protein [Halogranum amylolyticum]SEO58759.1 membrane protein DedA, SNARE-associated domain [Halogranum amylolyticum]
MTTVLQLGEMPSYLQDLLSSEYALLVLLAVFVLEGAMLMYIMPSELIVPGAILLVGDRTNLLAPENVLIIGIAVAGATVGQYALFKLAERGGRDYLLGKRWFRVSEEKLNKFDGWFQRWGPIVVPLSNSMLFTRGMLTVPAGFSELDGRRFMALSAVGTLSFELILAGLFVFSGRLL